MANGTFTVFYSGTDANNPPESELIYANDPVYRAFAMAVREIGGSNGIQVVESSSEAARDKGYAPPQYPAFELAIDGGNRFFLYGQRSYDSWYNSFLNILKSNGADGADPSQVQGGGLFFGLDENGYAFNLGDRDCNVVDKFLDFIKIGSIKQIVYGAGAAYLGYRAITTTNQVGIALSGGMAAGLGYLALKEPDAACKIDLNKDMQKVAIGAAVSVGFLAFYQFYLKDYLQERRLTRIVRTATGNNAPKRLNTRTTTTGRKKPKSVTVTKRF